MPQMPKVFLGACIAFTLVGAIREVGGLSLADSLGKRTAKLIKKCGSNHERALEILGPDVQRWHHAAASAAVEVCGRAGAVEEAVDILRRMESPSVAVFERLIQTLGHNNQPDRARAVLEELPRVGLKPGAACFSSAISASGRAGQWEEALNLLLKFEGSTSAPPDLKSYNVALMALGKAKRSVEAEELLARMVSRGVLPNVVSYNHLLRAMVSNGHQCCIILEQMKLCGIEPNKVSVDLAVDAARRGGNWELAATIHRGAERTHDRSKKLEDYHLRLRGLEKKGNGRSSSWKLGELRNFGIRPQLCPETVIYVSLVLHRNPKENGMKLRFDHENGTRVGYVMLKNEGTSRSTSKMMGVYVNESLRGQGLTKVT